MGRERQRFSEEQLAELQQAYNSSDDGLTRTRYQAVRLYGLGYEVSEIMEITGCSRSSLLAWCQRYREAGVAGLRDQRAGGNRQQLTAEQLENLEYRRHHYTPRQMLGRQTASASGRYWTVADLRQALHHWYGVDYKQAKSYRTLLEKCGLSYQRPAKVFKSHHAWDVIEFEESLEKN